jgi:hypothetical protein
VEADVEVDEEAEMNPIVDTTAYCTVDQVKNHGIDDTAFTDVQIQSAIALITAYIDAFFYLNLEKHLGLEYHESEDEWQHFVLYENKTKKFSGEGHYVLPLRGARLVNLTSITENGLTVSLNLITQKQKALYKYTNECCTVTTCYGAVPGKWVEGIDNINVTGDWGFATIPGDIQIAAARLVVMYLEGKVGDGIASFAAITTNLDSTAVSASASEIKSFKLGQPGGDIAVTFGETTSTTTRSSKDAIKAAVDSGLTLKAKTTGDAWCDSVFIKYLYKPMMGIKAL